MQTSEKPGGGGREQLTRRSSFRKSLAETALPEEYLGQLEEKRRQLDESIHKYIAAKERDYKTYEKELRHQHKNAQDQDGMNGVGRRRSEMQAAECEGRAADVNGVVGTRREEKGSPDGGGEDVAKLDRTAVAGLRDRHTSVERDKDFVGVFTPKFLPAINNQDGSDLASSAPSAVSFVERAELGRRVEHLERANSDTIVQAKPKRPEQLALASRTSSSGSSADGKLASAMKSPSQQPKRKRVSLAVGDSIVAPSDNVPAAPSNSNTPSHSRRQTDRQHWRQDPPREGKEAPRTTVDPRETSATTVDQASSQTTTSDIQAMNITSTPANSLLPTLTPANTQQSTPGPNKLDPDGDLFDLETIEDDPIDPPDIDEDEDALEDSDSDANDPPDDASNSHYSPSTAPTPIPSNFSSSTAPDLTFAPSSAVASQQPIKPGFRRPSVVDDPVYRGGDYRVAEQDAVENEVYGSSFARLSSKGSFTAGSLGESYMAKHAAEMMKNRRGRGEGGQVES
ncbi:hypothetical protein LTR09_000450 [Extremus antarcticus]|uniref:Uncharacterized protein n=1 Tax=Extremus antarcticus TaxID=702011 RepID=A0AAJ0GJN2_9PEZI|nr:hypothetical protein LTR09_000450 [Extremus antarcticus]